MNISLFHSISKNFIHYKYFKLSIISKTKQSPEEGTYLLTTKKDQHSLVLVFTFLVLSEIILLKKWQIIARFYFFLYLLNIANNSSSTFPNIETPAAPLSNAYLIPCSIS